MLAGSLLPGLPQLLDILWENEGAWEEAKLFLAKACLHLGQVPPQPVLPPNLKGAWKVVQLQDRNAYLLVLI